MGTHDEDGSVNESKGIRCLVSQLGAREHYLVARCFARTGALAALATDFWSPFSPQSGGIFRYLPKVILSALARRHADLDGEQVSSFPVLALLRHLIALIGNRGGGEQLIARTFARCIGRRRIPHNLFFGYSYDSLEILQQESRSGVFTILCQTDPGPGHYRMIASEEDRFPQYVSAKDHWWRQERRDRLRQEWELADVIVVNSQWSRDAIVAEGADGNKIEILPLAYSVDESSRSPKCGEHEQGAVRTAISSSSVGDRPLKVLWLGNVALGKGIHYLIEAARLLEDEPIEFLVGGASQISPRILETELKNLRWLGRIPRSQTGELYGSCDVFVFPTLSDGFGLTQLEAMAHGLPVIATPNCGSVVKNGVTGFVVPPRDPQALADAIMRFVHNPRLTEEMTLACLETVKAFSTDIYTDRLFEIIRKHMGSRGRSISAAPSNVTSAWSQKFSS